MTIKLKEWSLADAKRAQARVDAEATAAEQAWKRATKAAVDEGVAPPDPPDAPEAAIPQFHYAGERIFEVDASRGTTRAEVTHALAQYVKANPKPAVATTYDAPDASW